MLSVGGVGKVENGWKLSGTVKSYQLSFLHPCRPCSCWISVSKCVCCIIIKFGPCCNIVDFVLILDEVFCCIIAEKMIRIMFSQHENH
ncbi:hypothetical protein PMAYCL1PPCAC_23061 [Pristionchus mayeri]|uniref:Uncharacterized protein n=1 Tax=Pristionchus mayeri TaxID=1317129 RepID=A0AAN5CXD9_9BILA|nr:hypothetical protein PMAYCL1PPCAC_23058 [Pristionchus mayeri]GMR52866.1 hypothetical protein PMAYCL1PPCAC_23061 [Pristionchus mayeri]